VIARTLLDLGLLHTAVRQLIVASAAVNDIAAWTLLSLVSTLAAGSGIVLHLGWSVLAVIALVGTAIALRPALSRLMTHSYTKDGQPQWGNHIALTTIVILGLSASAQFMQLAAVFGAFFRGIAGRAGAAGREGLAPLRTTVLHVLSPLLSTMAGLRVDLTQLATPPLLIAAIGLLLIAIGAKLAGGYLGARLGRQDRRSAPANGVGLTARGAVEIIVASIGSQLGGLSTGMYSIIVWIAIASSLAAPPILRRALATSEATSHRPKASMSENMSPTPPIPLATRVTAAPILVADHTPGRPDAMPMDALPLAEIQARRTHTAHTHQSRLTDARIVSTQVAHQPGPGAHALALARKP
jgi:Kef-type K+ transport system membrane component KefB